MLTITATGLVAGGVAVSWDTLVAAATQDDAALAAEYRRILAEAAASGEYRAEHAAEALRRVDSILAARRAADEEWAAHAALNTNEHDIAVLASENRDLRNDRGQYPAESPAAKAREAANIERIRELSR